MKAMLEGSEHCPQAPERRPPNPSGRRLITQTYGRDPLLLAEVDLEARKVTAVSEPPAHVIWGDIPTPLF